MPRRLKILFVCGRNQWRSPTAARIYRSDPRVAVRSAGVSGGSRRRLGEDDMDWADLVLVMERRHLSRIRADFPGRESFPPIESLDIPDDYRAMDDELVGLIRSGTEPFIEAFHTSPVPPRAGRGPGRR
jgi:predicted protein tyrosine phosphatase